MRRAILRALLLLTPPFVAACGFSFERSSDVRDARILAIQAEPPEVIVGAGPLPDIRLRALVADPRKPERITEYEWRACVPDLRGTTLNEGGEDISGATEDGRCDESKDTTLIAAGEAPLGPFEATVTLPAELTLLAAAGMETGLSLHAQAQLRVSSPEGLLYGRKRVVVSPPVPQGRQANRNPRLTALLLDDTPWEPDQPRRLKLGECPDSKKRQIVDPDDPTRYYTRCAYTVTPVFDENEAEHYLVQTYAGETLELRERLRFHWFAGAGSFGSTQTAQPTNVGPQTYDPISTEWFEPAVGESATIWVVIRDGRGGTSWETREIVFEE